LSEIRATTISNAAGTGPIALTKQSAAKAFEKHQIDGTIDGSFNVSSITDNETGDYTINFSNSMNNNTYTACLHGSAGSSTTVRWMIYRGQSTTGFGVKTYAGSSQADMSNNMTAVHGDLA